MININPLKKGRIDEAVEMLEREFGSDSNRNGETIRGSLEEGTNRSVKPSEYSLRTGIYGNRYWYSVDENSRMNGIAGIHYQENDDESVWGGWTFVTPEKRLGLKRVPYALLKMIVKTAAESGREKFRLYMFEESLGSPGHKLYEKVGFKEYNREEDSDGRTRIYFEAGMEKIKELNEKIKALEKKHKSISHRMISKRIETERLKRLQQ